VTGTWRELYNEEIHDLFCLLNINNHTNAREQRQTHRNKWNNVVEKPEGTRSVGGPRLRLETDKNWNSKKQDRTVWTGFIWCRTGPWERSFGVP
jgi:hypothetical protein